MKKAFCLLVVLALLVAVMPPAFAHDVPTVEVSDQVSVDGTFTISHVTSEGPGWVVIHNQTDGKPGPVIGKVWVAPGESDNVSVRVENWDNLTSTVYAMLHVDDGAAGVYEFDGSSGLDNPVAVDGNVVTPPFNIELIHAPHMFVTDNTFTVSHVVTQQDGFLVIHTESEGKPGPVAGVAPIKAGVNTNVVVTLDMNTPTPNLWPMTHVDDGAVGTYEFDGSSGLDNPVVINGKVATVAAATYPSIAAHDQIIMHGDGMEMMMDGMAPTLMIDWVLAEVDGFVVAHNNNEGKPGPVAGVAPVKAGLNMNVAIELDPAKMTPLMFPMLHVDDGAVGTYEFDGSSGLDNPVAVDGNVVVIPVNIAPSFRAQPQALGEGNTLKFDEIVMDASGWIAIHSSVDGKAGPVIGTAPLNMGWNKNIVVTVDFSAVEGAATDQVFPMLHYDTGEARVYEFDGSNGLDLPVSVGGNIVASPLAVQ